MQLRAPADEQVRPRRLPPPTPDLRMTVSRTVRRTALAAAALTVALAPPGFGLATSWLGTSDPDVRTGTEVLQDSWDGDDEIVADWSAQRPVSSASGRLSLGEGNDDGTVRTAPRQAPWGDTGTFEVHGDGGDDVVREVGVGSTWITGGPGNDVLQGGGGQNQMDGGPGDDRVSGGAGHDLVVGGPGADDLRGGPGSDLLQTLVQRGNRWVDDGEVDRINCGPGYDMVVLGRGDRADRSCEVRYSILTRRLTGPRIIRRPRMCHDYVIGPSKPHTVLMGTNRRDCDEAVASPRAVAAFVVFGTGFGRRTSMRGVDVECRTNFVARVVFVGGLDLHNSAGGVGCVGFGMF